MCCKLKLRLFICVFLLCCVYNDVHAFTTPDSMLIKPLDLPYKVLPGQSSMDQSSNNVAKELNLNEEQMRKLHIWPSGVIPYYIDDLSFDKVLKDKIRLYFGNINQITGLLFTEIPRPPEDEKSRWVFLINRRGQLGCDDIPFHNFTNTGVQRIVLGYDCIANGKMSSVILSLVGIPPQHNAPNRNQFITINEKNILADKLYLFEKLKDDVWLFNNLTYDYYSAGHYCTHKYTSNGGDTITYFSQPKKVENSFEGTITGLSSTDLIKIMMLYKNLIRNREGSVRVPGCDKLFNRGSKPNTTDHIDSSKESNKYPQDTKPTENPFATDVYSFPSKENSSDPAMDKNKNDYGDENDAEVQNNNDNEENNDIDIESNHKLRDKIVLGHKKKKDNILKGSDYETDSDGNK